MKEFTAWSTNEKNNGINLLPKKEEIGFPKNEQEMFAKKYLNLAQKVQENSDKSMGLVKKIDILKAELHVFPEMNQKLVEANQKELSKTIEKENLVREQMDELFGKIDESTKQKYLTKIN